MCQDIFILDKNIITVICAYNTLIKTIGGYYEFGWKQLYNRQYKNNRKEKNRENYN